MSLWDKFSAHGLGYLFDVQFVDRWVAPNVSCEKPESLSLGSQQLRAAAEPLPQLIDAASEVSDETP
jgi:hypothetical protein